MSHFSNTHPAGERRAFGPAAWAAVFFTCFLLLFSSGRLNNPDSLDQLQAALLLAGTGSLRASVPLNDNQVLWAQAADGGYYEVHDIGSTLLMTPGALLARWRTPGSPEALATNPPALARAAASLAYTLACVLTAYFLFLTLTLYFPPRDSFLLALLFTCGTIFLAFAKTTCDVLGSCTAMSILLYTGSSALRRGGFTPGTAALAGAFVGAAASFRYSLVPFLAPAALWLVVRNSRAPRLGTAAAFCAGLTLVLLPTFAYNLARTGSPLIPATMSPKYAQTSDLRGDLLSGAIGLFFAPNRGLVWFSPIFLLLGAVPALWRSYPRELRALTLPLLLGAAGYVLLIAKLRNWAWYGYGPRYLIPVLPLLFLLIAPAVRMLFQQHPAAARVLTTITLALGIVPGLVNWSLVTSMAPQGTDLTAMRPVQQMETWKGLMLGLQGRELPAHQEIVDDPVRRGQTRFPDLFTFRLLERGGKAALAGGAVLFLLILGCGVTGWRLLSDRMVDEGVDGVDGVDGGEGARD